MTMTEHFLLRQKTLWGPTWLSKKESMFRPEINSKTSMSLANTFKAVSVKQEGELPPLCSKHGLDKH